MAVTKSTKIAAGSYSVVTGDGATFRVERTMGADAEFTREGWHLFEIESNGSEAYWNTFRTKAEAIAVVAGE